MRLSMSDILHRIRSFSVLRDHSSDRIAVFDLDHTLIDADLGEAVLAVLLCRGEKVGITWETYIQTRQIDPPTAYRDAVAAMGGLPEINLRSATAEVLTTRRAAIDFGNVSVPVPRPQPWARGFLAGLREMGMPTHVITATAHISAVMACRYHFGLDHDHVHGVRQLVKRSRLTDCLIEPAPIGQGKVDVYLSTIGDERPLVVATDSLLDLPLMQFCDPAGLALWAGNAEDGGIARALVGVREFVRIPGGMTGMSHDTRRPVTAGAMRRG